MKVKIGSRGSKLAVVQAEAVAALLRAAHPSIEIDFSRITTSGDRDTTPSIQAMGGKGVFVKEIEEALFKREIDLAVHSLKDVPQTLPPGLILGPCPKREDVRDVLISRFGEQLRELPKGSTIGTGSPRRVAQIRHRYWNRGYRLEPVRGNVDTRLRKVEEGQYDAIVLAAAGLKRLGLQGEVTEYLPPDEIMPAPAQGCLGLELRDDRRDLFHLLESIRDVESDITARAERAFLQALGGDCNVPVGAFSAVVGRTLVMKAVLLDPSGEKAVPAAQDGSTGEPELVGAQLAERLLHDGGSELLFAQAAP